MPLQPLPTGCPIPGAKGCVLASGRRGSDVLFVGEAAGSVEVFKGYPFAGPAGDELDRLLQGIGWARPQIANVLRCHPPGDYLVGASWEQPAIDHCGDHLEGVLNEGHKVVVTLGATALRAVLRLQRSRSKDGVRVQDFHGTVQRDPLDRFWVVPTFHPSFLLQGGAKFRKVVSYDLQVARDLAEGRLKSDLPALVIDPTPEWFDAWVDRYLADPEAWLSPDVETAEKASESDEGELQVSTAGPIFRINFACSTNEGVTVPWSERYLPAIRRALASPGVKVFWNAPFDTRKLQEHGVPVSGRVLDFMDAFKVFQSALPRGLGFVTPFYSHTPAWKHLGARNLSYCALDPVMALRCAFGLTRDLQAEGLWPVFERRMVQLDSVCFRPAEKIGLLFDRGELEKFDAMLGAELVRIEGAIAQIVPTEICRLDGPLVSRPEGADGSIVSKVEEVMAKVCTRCAASEVAASHMCDDLKKIPKGKRTEAPALELRGLQLPRHYRREPFNPASWQQVLAYLKLRKHKPGRAKKTKKDTTDKKTLLRLVKTGDPLYPLLLEHRRARKMKGTYAEGMLDRMDAGGRVHPTFTNTPSTLRKACVAEGTLVEIVRDVSKAPRGIPIEEVRVGDLAYTYDANRKLTLRPVLAAWKTGVRAIVRVHWMGMRGFTGHVDLTEDHEVLLTDREWRAAGRLKPADRVMSLHRDGRSGWYSRLYATGAEAVHDHRFVYKELWGSLPEAVHHKNENRQDNRPENLQGLTRFEHAQHHGITASFVRKKARLRALAKARKVPRRILRGPERPNWLGLPKEWMEQVLWDNAGKPTAFRDIYGIDYETAQKYLALHKIDVKAIRAEFNYRGARFTREMVEEGRAIHQRLNQEAAQQYVGLGYYKWKALQEKYGFLPYNHMVTKVERLDGEVPVYDLQIAETHNFIAGELCVHNCVSPNLQNVASHVQYAPEFRRCVVAAPGCLLGAADYSGIEAVLTGYFSGDPDYIRLAKLGIHAWVTGFLPEVNQPGSLRWSDEDLRAHFKTLKRSFPDAYDKAKRCVHGRNYGLTENGMNDYYPEVFPTRAAAAKMIALYEEVCPRLRPWWAAMRKFAHENHYLGGPFTGSGYVELIATRAHPFGYKHWFWNVLSFRRVGGVWKEYMGEDAKRALSFFPQSTAMGVGGESLLRLFDQSEGGEWIGDAFFGETPLRAMIHDDITVEFPEGERDRVMGAILREMTAPVKQLPLPAEWGLGEYLSIGVEMKVGRNWGPWSEANPEGMKVIGAEDLAADVAREEEEEDENDAA